MNHQCYSFSCLDKPSDTRSLGPRPLCGFCRWQSEIWERFTEIERERPLRSETMSTQVCPTAHNDFIPINLFPQPGIMIYARGARGIFRRYPKEERVARANVWRLSFFDTQDCITGRSKGLILIRRMIDINSDNNFRKYSSTHKRDRTLALEAQLNEQGDPR